MSVGVHFLPAPILAGTRMLIGAAIVLLFCALRGYRLFWNRGVMLRMMLLGSLLLFFGNLTLVWSEKYVPSGLAALIVAIVPLYVVLIEMSSGGDRLRPQGYGGLVLGFFALIALLWPSLRHGLRGHPMEFVGILVILGGAFSFALGSVLSRRMKLPVHPLVAAGWEMFAAGFLNVTLATLFWQWPHAVWNWQSVSAIGYLVLFGSLLGFSCYIWLLAHVSVAKVSTYAYMNPLVAVAMGALILHERLEITEYVGMIFILIAVALVTSSRMESGRSTAEVECAVVESEA